MIAKNTGIPDKIASIKSSSNPGKIKAELADEIKEIDGIVMGIYQQKLQGELFG